MWGMIVSLVQGIVTGVVGPVFTYMSKKQDVTLDGFKSATDTDRQTYAAWLDYQEKIQALKLQAASWWGPRALYMVVGSAAAFHAAAVFFDSTPFGIPFVWSHTIGSWQVPTPPGVYATYEGWVIGSLFVVSIAKGPLSAASAWLQRK